jgi:hypothetical protein
MLPKPKSPILDSPLIVFRTEYYLKICEEISLDLKKAGDGIRTRDPLLGKQKLYQLSYSRI